MQAAERLASYDKPFVIVERNVDVIAKYENKMLFVEGDANEDEILIEAGIERASFLIAAMPEDAENLFVVLSAKQLNKDIFVISRASQLTSQKKLQLAGADKVVMPD